MEIGRCQKVRDFLEKAGRNKEKKNQKRNQKRNDIL